MLIRTLFSTIVFLFLGNQLFAQGHYNGGSFNPNDYFTPPPGFIVPAYYSFANLNYYNSEGNRSDNLINPVPGNPTSLSLKQNVKTNSFIGMLIFGAKSKILGANWGMMVIPTVNNPSANIVLDYFTSQGGSGSTSFKNDSWGLGDLYIQPLSLTWTKPKVTYSLAYGLWAPVGKYSFGDTKNVGLGYWSHNIRVAARVKPDPQWSVVTAATLEVNSMQKGADFKEAPHLTFDYGFSYSFLKAHELGLFGFYSSQLGNDEGSQGSFLSDRLFGIGGYGSYWIKPGKLSVLGRFTQHFGARNRFAGSAFQVGLNILFLDVSNTK
ncbi:MAG: transporter [Sphingobacteriales bacterium]|jgi:hypothetical protein